MPTAEVTAVLETVVVATGERTEQRILDDDLPEAVRRAEGLYGSPVELHDGSLLFIEARMADAPVEAVKIAVHGPDKIEIEGIRFAVSAVHRIRKLKRAMT